MGPALPTAFRMVCLELEEADGSPWRRIYRDYRLSVGCR